MNDTAPVPARRGRKPSALRQQPQNDGPATGRVRVQGRDGEWLTRKRPVNTDLFHIPPEIIPAGYSYQWNVVDVMGQPQTASQLAMAENGWRPVPAGRHKGMFMPSDYSPEAAILRDGMRLEERPIELTKEAEAEEYSKARRLVADQNEQLRLTSALPQGFSRDNPNLRRMERQGTTRSFAPAPDVPRPSLPIDPAA